MNIKDLAEAKGTSAPVREALLALEAKVMMLEHDLAEERDRIVGIIQGRIDIHSAFIDSCMDNDVHVTPSIFSAIVELRSLLRKIECRD
jgi:hypothetical protein